MVSLRHIAQLAGVSHVSVLHALRGEPGLHPDTRQRILELASLFSYQPRHTDRQKSGLIGILIPDISSATFSHVLKGALQEAFLHDYRVVTLESNHDVQHSCKAIEVFIDMRVEGVLLAPGHEHQIPREYLLRLHSHGIYTVSLATEAFPVPLECIQSDPRQECELAVHYLMELGHRYIAYVGPITFYTGKPSNHYRAFIETVHQWHLPGPICADVHASSIAEIVQQLLHRHPVPTAIVAWSDAAALQLLQELTQQGYGVPRDISLIGSGNYLLTDLVTPPLTTIDPLSDQLGQRAMQTILGRLQQGEAPAAINPSTVNIDSKLIIRKSCASPRKNL